MRKANSFLAGAAWSALECYARCPLAAGRHRGAALVGRGMVGLWLRLMARGTFARSAGVRGVLSHSRERTKGRPVAANPRQHHGCPRTPPRLAWGWSLMWSEAIGFLAGAAWRGFGCCVARLLAAGRHRWAALVARKMVGLWLRLMARGSFARGAGKRGCSFPLAGKNQRAPGGSQSETAPWLPPAPSPLGLGVEPLVARSYSLPRGGGLERL